MSASVADNNNRNWWAARFHTLKNEPERDTNHKASVSCFSARWVAAVMAQWPLACVRTGHQFTLRKPSSISPLTLRLPAWLYALLFCPANCESWFTIDLVSEKAIVNTFEMLTLRVNSFAASLPHIPGCKVLCLFFSFTVSSTMATPFLDHVVRDRESIQSQSVKIFFWIRFQTRTVRKYSRSFLDSNREDIENISLSVLFRTTPISLQCPIPRSSLSNCCWMSCRRYSAASRLEVLLDEDDFSIFFTSSRTRKVSASFATACDNPGTLKSMAVSSSWVDCCPPTGLPVLGFLFLVGFVGCPCSFQLLLNPILSSNCLWRKSLEEAEVTHILSRIWFLQIPSQKLSRYNKLECIAEDDCITFCLIEPESFTLNKLYIDPIHRVLVSLPLFLLVPCKTWFGQIKLFWIFVFLVHGIHNRKVKNTVCLSLPKFCPPGINPEFVMECKLFAHPRW